MPDAVRWGAGSPSGTRVPVVARIGPRGRSMALRPGHALTACPTPRKRRRARRRERRSGRSSRLLQRPCRWPGPRCRPASWSRLPQHRYRWSGHRCGAGTARPRTARSASSGSPSGSDTYVGSCSLWFIFSSFRAASASRRSGRPRGGPREGCAVRATPPGAVRVVHRSSRRAHVQARHVAAEVATGSRRGSRRGVFGRHLTSLRALVAVSSARSALTTNAAAMTTKAA